MGCCISKCWKPKKSLYSFEGCNNVQDKLVISQAPKTPIIVSNKISPSPPSPLSSTSSISSFTCNTNNSESCSSLSSSASSVLCSKDRSFSNEFLWSCVQENPHIVRINSIKEAARSLATAKVQAPKFDSPARSFAAPVLKQSIPQRINGSTPQKRGRSSSPTPLTRQKSFRKEPERQNSSYSLPSRTLMRSPSPSRRFSGECNRGSVTNTTKESCPKRMVGTGPKVNTINSIPSLRKESFRTASPSNNSMGLRLCLRNRETYTYRVGSKIDEVAVGKALDRHEQDESIPMEDLDNPLISLDCFIFL